MPMPCCDHDEVHQNNRYSCDKPNEHEPLIPADEADDTDDAGDRDAQDHARTYCDDGSLGAGNR